MHPTRPQRRLRRGDAASAMPGVAVPGSAADHRIVRKTGCIIDSFILCPRPGHRYPVPCSTVPPRLFHSQSWRAHHQSATKWTVISFRRKENTYTGNQHTRQGDVWTPTSAAQTEPTSTSWSSPTGSTGRTTPTRVAAAILKHGPIARTTLAQDLGLSQGALSRITSDLIYDGVVEESSADPDESAETRERRGRPLTALRIRQDARTFVGVKINAHLATAVAINAHSTIVSRPHSHAISEQSPDVLARTVAELVAACAGRSGGCAPANADGHRHRRRRPYR